MGWDGTGWDGTSSFMLMSLKQHTGYRVHGTPISRQASYEAMSQLSQDRDDEERPRKAKKARSENIQGVLRLKQKHASHKSLPSSPLLFTCNHQHRCCTSLRDGWMDTLDVQVD
mmetsp:Transcript_17258/g.28358  ORF Transcript_17258/g.28358 Transcript_17258/m.28358 type:complete len:114 (-) Transcript_17258:2230-2571(-)